MDQEPLDRRIRDAIRRYWATRQSQHEHQGVSKGLKDAGNRAAVTGGAHIDGFIDLMKELLFESGLREAEVVVARKQAILPGYFRPTKQWDLLVISGKKLIGIIEFKSQVGPSFGNNFNNRVEEALGSATDLWKAFREGAFRLSERPWLGYFMLLDDCRASVSSVRLDEPHFPVLDVFRDTSYTDRYRIFCERLVLERLYDAACFMTSNQEGTAMGDYTEPSPDLSFRTFATSLMGRAVAFSKMRE
ncbi:MAG: PaeR7I family type II restriction endonuclease [Thermodesulfobacteriota bacterium]